MRSRLDPDDLLLAAGVAVECLAAAPPDDWEVPAGSLSWTCRSTLDHTVDTLFWYSVQLASGAQRALPSPRRGDPTGTVPFLLTTLRSSAAVLAAVVRAADPSVRAFHPVGMADPEGFTAMGCDEILVHADDIARGLGVTFEPPSDLCTAVLERLFPWAPADDDPFAELLWANGRVALADRPRLTPDWSWHCAPLDEWDGTIPRCCTH
jgi:uncharacterized protein (TIGR03083 family)